MADGRFESIMRIVDEALSSTLENMAFAEVIALRKEPDTSVVSELNVWSSLNIIEPKQGRIAILLSKLLADSLVSSIYGMFDESEITPTHLLDATNEVLNTLSGQLSVKLFGTDTLYNLGLPEFGLIRDNPEYASPGDRWIRVDYSVEGWLMSVLVDKTFAE